MLCAPGPAVGVQADGDGTVLECSGAGTAGIVRAHLYGTKPPESGEQLPPPRSASPLPQLALVMCRFQA